MKNTQNLLICLTVIILNRIIKTICYLTNIFLPIRGSLQLPLFVKFLFLFNLIFLNLLLVEVFKETESYVIKKNKDGFIF